MFEHVQLTLRRSVTLLIQSLHMLFFQCAAEEEEFIQFNTSEVIVKVCMRPPYQDSSTSTRGLSGYNLVICAVMAPVVK